jgi:septal ring factor EnvC (AmiA/AmiB activator)
MKRPRHPYLNPTEPDYITRKRVELLVKEGYISTLKLELEKITQERNEVIPNKLEQITKQRDDILTKEGRTEKSDKLSKTIRNLEKKSATLYRKIKKLKLEIRALENFAKSPWKKGFFTDDELKKASQWPGTK